MKARLTAAGLADGAARPGQDEPASARVTEARARASDRGDAQRQALRPLGLVFIAGGTARARPTADGWRVELEVPA